MREEEGLVVDDGLCPTRYMRCHFSSTWRSFLDRILIVLEVLQEEEPSFLGDVVCGVLVQEERGDFFSSSITLLFLLASLPIRTLSAAAG